MTDTVVVTAPTEPPVAPVVPVIDTAAEQINADARVRIAELETEVQRNRDELNAANERLAIETARAVATDALNSELAQCRQNIATLEQQNRELTEQLSLTQQQLATATNPPNPAPGNEGENPTLNVPPSGSPQAAPEPPPKPKSRLHWI